MSDLATAPALSLVARRIWLLLILVLLVTTFAIHWYRQSQRAEQRAHETARETALDNANDILDRLGVMERNANLMRGTSTGEVMANALAGLSGSAPSAADRIRASLPGGQIDSLLKTTVDRTDKTVFAIRADLEQIDRLDDGVCAGSALDMACFGFITEAVARLERLAQTNEDLDGRRSMRTLRQEWQVMAPWMQGRLQPEAASASAASNPSNLTDTLEAIRRSLVDDVRGRIFDTRQDWRDIVRAVLDQRPDRAE